jgi:imidazolonepropionase-like amidohydrolase
MHDNSAVRVKDDRMEAAGPASGIDTAGAKVVDLPGATLLPGLVEGQSHILLHE